MSDSPARLASSFRATTAFRAAASMPDPAADSGMYIAADATPVTPARSWSAPPTSRTMSSRSAGRMAESAANRSTTSTGTIGPISCSRQR